MSAPAGTPRHHPLVPDRAVAASRYRWVILAVGVGAQAAPAGVHQGLPAIGPHLRDRYHLSLAGLGMLLAAFVVGMIVMVLPWGALADRVGERIVIGTGLLLAAVPVALAAVPSSATGAGAALFIAGMLAASANAASGRAVVGWFGMSERGLALGIRHMATPLAGAVAAVALPVAVAIGGVRAALLCLAAATLAAGVAAAVWLRDPPDPAAAAVTAPGGGARSPFRDPSIWRLAGGASLFVLTQISLVSFVVVYLHDERGWSDGGAAAVLAAIQVLGAAGRVTAGRWSDRLRRRVAPLRVIVLAAGTALAVAALATGAPDAVLVPLLVAATVLAMSGNALTQVATAELAGWARAGTALGLQNTILFATTAGAAPAFGALVAATSWRDAFLVAAALPLLSAAVLSPLRRVV